MQRHDREVFGIDASDLMDIADIVYASAYLEQSIQNTNDGVRTGVEKFHHITATSHQHYWD